MVTSSVQLRVKETENWVRIDWNDAKNYDNGMKEFTNLLRWITASNKQEEYNYVAMDPHLCYLISSPFFIISFQADFLSNSEDMLGGPCVFVKEEEEEGNKKTGKKRTLSGIEFVLLK